MLEKYVVWLNVYSYVACCCHCCWRFMLYTQQLHKHCWCQAWDSWLGWQLFAHNDTTNGVRSLALRLACWLAGCVIVLDLVLTLMFNVCMLFVLKHVFMMLLLFLLLLLPQFSVIQSQTFVAATVAAVVAAWMNNAANYLHLKTLLLVLVVPQNKNFWLNVLEQKGVLLHLCMAKHTEMCTKICPRNKYIPLQLPYPIHNLTI